MFFIIDLLLLGLAKVFVNIETASTSHAIVLLRIVNGSLTCSISLMTVEKSPWNKCRMALPHSPGI